MFSLFGGFVRLPVRPTVTRCFKDYRVGVITTRAIQWISSTKRAERSRVIPLSCNAHSSLAWSGLAGRRVLRRIWLTGGHLARHFQTTTISWRRGRDCVELLPKLSSSLRSDPPCGQPLSAPTLGASSRTRCTGSSSRLPAKEKSQQKLALYFLAERAGFEPAVHLYKRTKD